MGQEQGKEEYFGPPMGKDREPVNAKALWKAEARLSTSQRRRRYRCKEKFTTSGILNHLIIAASIVICSELLLNHIRSCNSSMGQRCGGCCKIRS